VGGAAGQVRGGRTEVYSRQQAIGLAGSPTGTTTGDVRGMAEDRPPPVFGLWNETIGEWFNPGTRRPYFSTREAAERAMVRALRDYPMGKWEIREYPVDLSALDDDVAVVPPPARPDAA
jgi:hypothetical protein